MDSHWLVGFQVAHARDMLAMSEAGSGSVFVNAHGGARGPWHDTLPFKPRSTC